MSCWFHNRIWWRTECVVPNGEGITMGEGERFKIRRSPLQESDCGRIAIDRFCSDPQEKEDPVLIASTARKYT